MHELELINYAVSYFIPFGYFYIYRRTMLQCSSYRRIRLATESKASVDEMLSLMLLALEAAVFGLSCYLSTDTNGTLI